MVSPDGGIHSLDAGMVAHLAAEASRPLTLRELEGANFDDSPLVMVNLATLASFEVQARVRVDHRRFRANLYVGGLEPEEEIGWLGRRVAVGGAEVEVVSASAASSSRATRKPQSHPPSCCARLPRHTRPAWVCTAVSPGRVEWWSATKFTWCR